ncbi:unnamed protein product [Lasius platythorax]|uniref:Uncharacterized protein n=1 Tax=Lasius platythorax TaxID=488582 RepID=A0AAV2PDE2_9HYME
MHFGGLRPCSASPKITVVEIIDRRRRRFVTECFAFSGKWIRKTLSVCAIAEDEASRLGYGVSKVQHHLKREFRKMSRSFWYCFEHGIASISGEYFANMIFVIVKKKEEKE